MLLATLLLLLAAPASASSLRGTVVDARSGAAVAGARVRVVSLADDAGRVANRTAALARGRSL